MNTLQQISREANRQMVLALREQMLKKQSVEPADFGLNLVTKILTAKGVDHGLSVMLLSAIVHHSLKRVSKEAFVREMEEAMNDFSDHLLTGMGK